MTESCGKTHKKIETPLARAKGLGSAKSGYKHWWMQRVTALALIPLSVWLLFHLPNIFTASYAEAQLWMSDPWNAVTLLLFLWAAFYHALLGLEVIIEDYVHCHVGKPVMLIFTRFLFLGAGVMAVYAVLKINFA